MLDHGGLHGAGKCKLHGFGLITVIQRIKLTKKMGHSESEVVFPQNNINRISRLLRREQNSLFNCLSSLHHDASFVEEIALLYPAVPLLANLRCGLWYTPSPAGTCYFKSTDGHNGNWSFSTMRLNWNVCEQAAAHGGVIIVDATRKGKRFPVSFQTSDGLPHRIPGVWNQVQLRHRNFSVGRCCLDHHYTGNGAGRG